MEIVVDSPTSPAVRQLLEDHLRDMFATSPPESVHALPPEKLADPHVTFFSVRDEGVVVGCGAMSELSPAHGELKSMRLIESARGKGYASALLTHLITVARERGYERVSLETGAEDFFAPARRLYERHGFTVTGPFAEYTDDPNSVYYTLAL
ncbi:putative acetyltransferase [Microbacteriaceae bacterium SG_E_30_P1]|uniref:Acetyltransferase n=1 Tax=Antiquaquibacter oligotrophicus TaxID=2880260 RepID=A0ABT6KQW8_9MICO|nr:putative acetyltransferase [Antiquaquibacter oligotrophicus]